LGSLFFLKNPNMALLLVFIFKNYYNYFTTSEWELQGTFPLLFAFPAL